MQFQGVRMALEVSGRLFHILPVDGTVMVARQLPARRMTKWGARSCSRRPDLATAVLRQVNLEGPQANCETRL